MKKIWHILNKCVKRVANFKLWYWIHIHKTSHLGEQQEKLVDKLFTNNFDIFATNISEEGQMMELTQIHIIEHTINTGDEKPIAQWPYWLVHAENDFVKKKISKMLNIWIIQESKSLLSSLIVLVPKKNKKIHICIDYWKLNKITEKNVYPLPNIELFWRRMMVFNSQLSSFNCKTCNPYLFVLLLSFECLNLLQAMMAG